MEINKDLKELFDNVKAISYEDLLKLPPEKRVREPSVDLLHDKISGILIAFSFKLQLRDGHIDIITLKDAEKEIKELIIDYVK